MSEKHKVFDSKIPYFVTITITACADVFTRSNYSAI